MGQMGVSTKTLTSLKLRVDLSRVGATTLMANPASVPEAGGACHLINSAYCSEESTANRRERFIPVWVSNAI